MRQNSGRSTTLSLHPERQYLLKGIIRCTYCKMLMWAQTYESGRRYYREHRESRSQGQCPAHGGSILCRLADDQVGRIIEAIELGPAWEEQVLSIISAIDEIEVVRNRRRKVQDKLRRLAKAYVDGIYDDQEYRRQKPALAQIHRRDDYAAAERAIGAREGDGPGTIWGRGGPVSVFSCRGETL